MRIFINITLLLFLAANAASQPHKYYMEPVKQQQLLTRLGSELNKHATDSNGVRGYYVVFMFGRVYGCMFFQKELFIHAISFSLKENEQFKLKSIPEENLRLSGIDILFDKNKTFFTGIMRDSSCHQTIAHDTYNDRYFMYYRGTQLAENSRFSNELMICNKDFVSSLMDWILNELSN